MKAVNLKVEYMTNPIGIDIVEPRFSWSFDEGLRQKAYQIKAVDFYGNILWDTGKVESSQMHLIKWQGQPLQSRTIVNWTVTVWDEEDKLEESSQARFEMGLLTKGDWKAKWITGDYTPKKKERYPVDCFKKSFTTRAGCKLVKARAYMTACGLYEGQLNGKKMGAFMLAPGITDYRKRMQYQTVDITDLVFEGDNELFFMLADGWYRGSVGAWAMKNYYGNTTRLLAQIELSYQDGSVDIIATDAQIFVNTASYMVNYAPFALKYQNDLCDWQTADGNFPQIAPEGGTDSYMRGMNGSVGWSDAGILIPYRLWKKYGDKHIIERYYDNMKRYAGYMIGRTGKKQFMISEKTGLSKEDSKYLYNMGQHYGEWAEPADVHTMNYKDFMSSRPEEATAYLSYVMGIMVEIAEALGHKEDIPLYKEYRDGAKVTYQKLVHTKKYSLDTDRQARLVRPLYMDLLNDEDTFFAKKRLVKALNNYDWRVGTGFLSTPFILYVLKDIDIEYAYRLLENEKNPGWLCMPKAGATTIWEDWAGPNSDNGKGGGIASLNHYSKGAACEWVFDTMCGIQVDGENHFIIAPQPGGHFSHAGMTYNSVYGKVSCKWEKISEGKYQYKITIPPNTSATLRLKGMEEIKLSPGTYIH